MSNKKIDREVNEAIEELMRNILPKEIEIKTRKHLAKKSGLSDETLRTVQRRKNLNIDTFFRILYGRGVSLKELTRSIKTKKFSMLLENEAELIRFGMKLKEEDRGRYLDLLKFIHSRWK